MGVKLVALDIDGTIIPFKSEHGDAPSPRIREAVRAARARGIEVVLASGRMFPGAVRVARTLELNGVVISQEGASVHRADGTLLYEYPIEFAYALEITAYAQRAALDYEWFNTTRYAATRESEATRHYGEICGITPEYHPNPETLGIVPNGVGILSDNSRAPEIHRELASHHGDRIHLLDFPHVTVAVSAEASKGHALSRLCADLGIAREETLAIGDSVNDAAMLAWAGRGLAMAKSDGYARDAADEVLPDRDDIVAEVLDSLV